MNKGRILSILAIGIVGILAVGTWRDGNFWLKPDRRGDWLMKKGKYLEAAKAYADPWHVGMAQFRNSDFEATAHTFARVPGAAGAYDQGNAWLMHGQYDSAVASYDRALGFKPGWKEAGENRALALARKALIDGAGKDRDQESAEAYKPDDIAFDQKGEDKKGEPQEMAEGDVSDKELQASWLRRVTTTPGDFLRAKFAYQAAKGGAK